MTKKERIYRLIEYYANGRPTTFAKQLGVAPSTISSWIARDSMDYDLIFAKCEEISPEWLLSGEGDMLRESCRTTALLKHGAVDRIHKESPGIPLVSQKAVGGFSNGDFNIPEGDILGYYVIPRFRYLDVDFMIEVTGDSMTPRLCPGDIIACSVITNPRFIQWNKCHLIASREQGLLVKRLLESGNPDYFKAVSDNRDYPPFDIPKDDICGLARVVGSIHID